MDSISDSDSEDIGSIPIGTTKPLAKLFYTYVIKSSDSDFFYKGHCADLNVRLNQHNAGKVASTKRFAPFEFVYYESFRTREEAIRREKYFKTAAGRRFLKVAIPRFQIPLPD